MTLSTLSYTTSDEILTHWLDQMLHEAIRQLASDIHIEPYAKYCRIRYRCDGLLNETSQIHLEMGHRLITLLKVMAKLNIAEKRLPQDGRFQMHGIDIRINVCPTLFGEKIVLRLLNSHKMTMDLNHLGMNAAQKNILLEAITKPQGLILVSGPTGSGKTITLYSILNYLNSSEKNISTVEDPVEIQLSGVNQIPINTKIGLDFPCVLRTLLRQDPDVMMIGEIRDQETADIAVQAALTGHLILSTVHANHASEIVARLMSLGVPAVNLISALSLMVSQRLLRKLCIHCKQKEPFSKDGYPIYCAKGCEKCMQGYKGRCAIYEILPMTPDLAVKILEHHPEKPLVDDQSGSNTLQIAANNKILEGITSQDEVKRVLGTDSIF